MQKGAHVVSRLERRRRPASALSGSGMGAALCSASRSVASRAYCKSHAHLAGLIRCPSAA